MLPNHLYEPLQLELAGIEYAQPTHCRSVPKKKSLRGTFAGDNCLRLSDFPMGATREERRILWGTAGPSVANTESEKFKITKERVRSMTATRNQIKACEELLVWSFITLCRSKISSQWVCPEALYLRSMTLHQGPLKLNYSLGEEWKTSVPLPINRYKTKISIRHTPSWHKLNQASRRLWYT